MISDLYLISEKDKNKYLDLAEKQITQFSKELPEITILFQSLCINVMRYKYYKKFMLWKNIYIEV